MNAVNNTLIGAVRAEATLESGKFVDGAKKIRKEAKQTEVQVKKSFGEMGGAIRGFGTALTAGLSIGLLSGLIQKSLDYATSIKDVAAQVGVTTRELQEFRHAAAQVGVSQAEADKGLEKLNLTLGKAAQGSKTAKEALAAVGVSLKDIQTKSRLEIFNQIADAMVKQGGAAKNAAAANAVFGEGASKLAPLLDKGSQGVNELRASVHALGGVLSEEQIQQADVTARKLDDVRRVLAFQFADVVTKNSSSIISLANALGQLTTEIVNFLNSNPAGALAILGALIGARVGGLPGAALGAFAGAAFGPSPSGPAPDKNFLKSRFIQEANVLKQMRAAGQPFGDQQAKVRRLRDRYVAAGGVVPGFNNGPAFGSGLPQFLAPDPKSGRKGRTPKAPRDRSDDVTFQFDQELRRAQIDVLRAQQGLARTSEDRAEIALKLLDAEKAMQEAELNDRVRRAERDFAEGKITASALEQAKVQADKLRAEYEIKDALDRKAIADDLAAEKARDAAALADSSYDIQLEKLQLEAALADTAGERREAELRILDLMKQQEKARLEAVIADQQSSELAKAQARQRLAELDNIYAGRRAGAIQGTRGPLEQAQSEFSDLTDEMENLKVQGIMGVADAFTTLLSDTENWKDATISMVRQVIAEFIRMQTIKFLFSMLNTASGGIPGLGSGTPMFSPSNPGVGFASGGFTGNMPRNRIAGVVHGQEGVLNARAMGALGIPNLNMLNRGAPLSAVAGNDNASAMGGFRDIVVPVTLPAGMSSREGRRTGLAIGRGFQEAMGYTIRGRR